jgi:hypothetical protein
MRPLALLVLSLTLFVPAAASAHDHDDALGSIDGFDVHRPVEWGHRHDARRARIEIVTEDRGISLLLTDDRVALQLSDQTMHRVDRELERARHEDDDDDIALARAIKTVVIDGVHSLLERSLECPVDELSDVRIRDGRLELIGRDGRRIFERVRIDDEPVLERFSDADQRAFVDAFHRLRGRGN